MFIKNNLFGLFNFYADLPIPELYLSFKSLQDASTFLRAADVDIANTIEKGAKRVFCISGEDNIRKAFQAFERADFLPADETSDCLQQLQNKASFVGLKLPKTSVSTSYSSANLSIDLNNHETAALAAAKEGNTLLIQILLGNQITADDLEEFKTACINLDVGRDKEYCAELEYEALVSQLEALDQFLALPEESQDINHLADNFAHCIRQAKAMMMGVKFSYAEHRPYVVNQLLENDAMFESWLEMIFAQHILSGVFTSLDPTINLSILRNVLNNQLKAADGLINKLQLGREQIANDFAEIQEHLSKKEKYHLTLINSFLAEPRFLPALYQYNNAAEKITLIQLLKAMKISVDTCDAEGNTLLHHALNRMHLGLANVLLQQGANINLRNHTGRTAAEYAGINSELLDKIKLNPTYMLAIQSKFLEEAQKIFDHYEATLSSKEKDLQSFFWSLFEDKDIIEERRQSKITYEETLAKAKATGNQGLLAQAIEIGSPKEKTKRGLRGRSRFHDELMQLVQDFRSNPEEYGLTAMDKTVFFLVNENNEQALTINKQQDKISTLEREKITLSQEKETLAKQTADAEKQKKQTEIRCTTLETEKTTLENALASSLSDNKQLQEAIELYKKTNSEQKQIFEQESKRRDVKFRTLEAMVEKLMATQDKMAHIESQSHSSLPDTTSDTHRNSQEFFGSHSSHSSASSHRSLERFSSDTEQTAAAAETDKPLFSFSPHSGKGEYS